MVLVPKAEALDSKRKLIDFKDISEPLIRIL